jgi:hypothetical protein
MITELTDSTYILIKKLRDKDFWKKNKKHLLFDSSY